MASNVLLQEQRILLISKTVFLLVKKTFVALLLKNAVSADLCLKIGKNWVQRLDFCKGARAGHAKEIEFHSKWRGSYFYRNKEFY